MSNLCNCTLPRTRARAACPYDLLVIGVGNVWRHDDGIDPKIIEILKTKPNLNCDLCDGGLDALALLDEIQKYPRALIIDAVHMGSAPSTIKIFTPSEAKLKIHADALSTHGFGLAELIQLMESLNIPTRLKILGIEPKDISFGEGLSIIVSDKIDTIIDLILEN
jgi:hydrogenase maturation protease